MKNHLRLPVHWSFYHWGWHWNWIALFLSLTVVPVVAWGQSRPEEPRSRPASPAGRVLRLSLGQAVEIALQPEGNARIQMAEQLIRQAQARSAETRAALLPDLSGSVGLQNQRRNLEALGLQVQSPIPGVVIPRSVGPFSTFDARAFVSQKILDLAAIRRFQASRTAVRVAHAEDESTRDQVSQQVGRAYLAGMRAEASLETARANLALAEGLLRLAVNQKAAGTGTGIEVTRARVQLAHERQRVLASGNERERTHLELLKLLGFKLDTELELTDALAYLPAPTMEVTEALATAMESRAEWKAQQKREHQASLNYSATKLERLPSLVGFLDYGSIGVRLDRLLPTHTLGVALQVPVFDGGRREARRAESLSQLRQERIRTHDLREQIELEIRVALDSLRSTEQQVEAAQEGRQLAENELAQARRRYQAGVTSSLEVTDAQTRLVRAREDHINALFNHNLARIDLGAAMGTVRQVLQQSSSGINPDPKPPGGQGHRRWQP